MASEEREFVVLEPLAKYSDDDLVDVLERLEGESASVIAEVRAENKRRSEVAIEAALGRARKSGVKVSVGGQDSAPPKGKRGPKPKPTAAEIEAAVARELEIDVDEDAAEDRQPLDAE